MKRIAIALLLVSGAIGQPRSRGEYALVLEDPPVAQKVHGRAALQSQTAQAHLGRIRAAQTAVRGDLARRKVPVSATAQLLVNAVFVRTTAGTAISLGALPGV